jgi:hypothetical protein
MQRCEASHLPLAPAGRLVGRLDPAVQPRGRAHVQVLDGRELWQRRLRCAVARQAVGDDLVWCAARVPQQATEEPRSRVGIPTLLDEDIQHLTGLVDGPPRVDLPPTDATEHLVAMPSPICTPPVNLSMPLRGTPSATRRADASAPNGAVATAGDGHEGDR